MHISVLLHEAVDALAIKPNGIYVDGTFGRGGHSRLILSQLSEDGRLIVFDKDPAAVLLGEAIEDKRFCIQHGGFSGMQRILREMGVAKIDGVLLDSFENRPDRCIYAAWEITGSVPTNLS